MTIQNIKRICWMPAIRVARAGVAAAAAARVRPSYTFSIWTSSKRWKATVSV